MKITLDNNCIINLFDTSSSSATSVDELNELMQLALSSEIEIAITTRVEADLNNDRNDARRAELLRLISFLKVVGTVCPDSSTRLRDEIQKILWSGGLNPNARNYMNRLNDIDHLVGHKINDRDIFVTDDKDILKKAEILIKSPGIAVMNPGKCVKTLNNWIENHKSKPLISDKPRIGYENHSLAGEARFDYSNNDGRYTIGKGNFLFETEWKKASDVSIYTLRA